MGNFCALLLTRLLGILLVGWAVVATPSIGQTPAAQNEVTVSETNYKQWQKLLPQTPNDFASEKARGRFIQDWLHNARISVDKRGSTNVLSCGELIRNMKGPNAHFVEPSIIVNDIFSSTLTSRLGECDREVIFSRCDFSANTDGAGRQQCKGTLYMSGGPVKIFELPQGAPDTVLISSEKFCSYSPVASRGHCSANAGQFALLSISECRSNYYYEPKLFNLYGERYDYQNQTTTGVETVVFRSSRGVFLIALKQWRPKLATLQIESVSFRTGLPEVLCHAWLNRP